MIWATVHSFNGGKVKTHVDLSYAAVALELGSPHSSTSASYY